MTHHQHQPQSGQSGGNQPRQQTGGQRGRRQPGSQQTGGQQMTERMEGQQRWSQQMGTQGAGRQQPSGQQRQQPGSQAQSFDDHMTDELRLVLEDFSELSHVAAWCATECASGPPALGTCARICQDIAEIAELNEMLVARDSMFGPEVADMFVRVASEGLPELQQFQHYSHVAETMATIERTMNSCESILQQVGQGSQLRETSTTAQMTDQQY